MRYFKVKDTNTLQTYHTIAHTGGCAQEMMRQHLKYTPSQADDHLMVLTKFNRPITGDEMIYES